MTILLSLKMLLKLVNDNNKQCDYGVLCRIKRTYITGEEYTIDGCGHIIIVGNNSVVFSLLVIFFKVMIII